MSAPYLLNPQDRLDWLRLIRSENVGPVGFYQLLHRYGSAGAALEALPELARRGGKRQMRLYPRGEAEREMVEVQRLGARLVAWGEADYPPLLAELDDAPPLITIRGHGTLAARSTIAMVGARNASAAGNRFARDLAHDLGAAGVVVVSGLARGIDGAAHIGALDTGTVAVVAGGADIVYPEEHRRLHDEIAERGAVVAEMPVGTIPQARHFPRRNRIISGLSLGVVVIEAALRSGSLITARFAGEQGRDVFAVPGSPLDPRCRGTNDLIRNGAVLTESAADIFAVMRQATSRIDSLAEGKRRRFGPGNSPGNSITEPDNVQEAARSRVMSLLSPTAVTVDELLRQCHLSASVLVTILLELELAGRLDRHPGQQVSLR
ncbi:MAG TPA: DNA-processing protein DprA [Stellaceae bacterium]|nr:DNA-processing protein DprA [Stellaceae bacterium]